jgi:hypothetical protein
MNVVLYGLLLFCQSFLLGVLLVAVDLLKGYRTVVLERPAVGLKIVFVAKVRDGNVINYGY